MCKSATPGWLGVNVPFQLRLSVLQVPHTFTFLSGILADSWLERAYTQLTPALIQVQSLV